MVKCIVVDDNLDIVDVFCELLGMIGLEVIAKGTDGMQAVELYEKHHPDLIFVDLLMPRYDGFYAMENIRKTDPNAKIIVVTGDLIMNEYDLLHSHNATAVIYKPFDMGKVKQTLESISLDDVKLPKINKRHTDLN
ncbi:MAG TPA: response regulator [Nitrosarchaeum sp.]|nr:response regulator [Nitrosarchaeum sp.]